MHGGHLVVFVDPEAEMDALPVGSLTGTAAGTSSDLPRLFKAWGVVFDPRQGVAGPGQRHVHQPRREQLRRCATSPSWGWARRTSTTTT